MPLRGRLTWIVHFLAGGGVGGIFFGLTSWFWKGLRVELNAIFSLLIGFVLFVISTGIHEATSEQNREEHATEGNALQARFDEAVREKEEEFRQRAEQEIRECDERVSEQRRFFEGQLASMSAAIERITGHFDKNFQYEHSHFNYYVGLSDEDDRWTRDYLLKANRLLYADREVKFGARGTDVGEGHTWDELRVKITKINEGAIEIVPRFHARDQKHWLGDMFFLPPVKAGSEREFTLAGRWPGTWYPLRNRGKDTGSLVLTKETKLLRISIVLPDEIAHAEFGTLSPRKYAEPPRGKTRTWKDDQGRVVLTWEITDAERIVYTYEILCPEFPRLLGSKLGGTNEETEGQNGL